MGFSSLGSRTSVGRVRFLWSLVRRFLLDPRHTRTGQTRGIPAPDERRVGRLPRRARPSHALMARARSRLFAEATAVLASLFVHVSAGGVRDCVRGHV